MATATEHSERLEKVDALVREMFQSLATQPLPSRLLSVLDQLEDEPVVEAPLKHQRWSAADADAVGELKPYQLRLAQRLGMRTPKTLLTNNPDEVVRLVKGTDQRIVYKAFTGGVIHYPGAFPSGLLTTVVGDEILQYADRIRHTMCMFQEYIDKAYEIRLTVVGNTFFPVVISSQEMDSTAVDWRGENQLPYGPYKALPQEIVDRVQQMFATLDIVYGAVDFIVTPESDFVFLEVNPGGQFMWMQHDLGLDMSGCFADLLTAGEPFRRGEVTQIGY